MKTYKISSSIANFSEKLKIRYYDYQAWDLVSPCLFFGLYHIGDYLPFLLHRGKRTVFWCGSDILNLQKRPFWQKVIRSTKAKHYCENTVEHAALLFMGIHAEIHPMIFADPKDFPALSKPSHNPKVWICTHKGREVDYGMDTIVRLAEDPDLRGVKFHVYGEVDDAFLSPYIVYHGQVPEAQFNREIKGYQCGLRLNSFDGFSEVSAKSILLGQYPITIIPYPNIDQAKSYATLKASLLALKKKKVMNPYRAQWYDILSKRIEA